MATTDERGYDYRHKQERLAWAPLVARGDVVCRRASVGECVFKDHRIKPGQRWDLGHPDATCPAPKAPEHLRCNRRTNAADRQVEIPRPVNSRRW